MTQKLYTEEQVRKIINELVEDATPLLVGEILSEYDPIELPSDEEIDRRVKEVGAMGEYYKMGYRDAIIWYREHLKQITMAQQTAMQKLLYQLKDERMNMPIPIEWDKCYRAIEMSIENTYLPIEKDQIKDGYDHMRCIGNYENGEQYYNETYGSKGNNDKINLVEIPQEQLEQERNPAYKYFDIDETKGSELTTFKESSQTEISDDEYYKDVFYQKQIMNPYSTGEQSYTAYEKGFMDFAKWYRERLKSINPFYIDEYGNPIHKISAKG